MQVGGVRHGRIKISMGVISEFQKVMKVARPVLGTLAVRWFEIDVRLDSSLAFL